MSIKKIWRDGEAGLPEPKGTVESLVKAINAITEKANVSVTMEPGFGNRYALCAYISNIRLYGLSSYNLEEYIESYVDTLANTQWGRNGYAHPAAAATMFIRMLPVPVEIWDECLQDALEFIVKVREDKSLYSQVS